MDFARTHRRFPELNLTALIDIVFHLLVFVMLTTSFVVVESMELSLPSSGAETSPSTAQPMRLEIQQGGVVWVDGRPRTQAELEQALASRLAANPATRIVILSASGVSVQQLVSVMDAVYLAGGRDVQVDKATP